MAVDFVVIGQRLKSARKRVKLTQEGLAEKLNVSVAYVSRIKRGNSHINLKRLTDFCKILNVTEGEILNGVAYSNNNYLASEFSDILNSCSPEKQKLIYNISKLIAEDNK